VDLGDVLQPGQHHVTQRHGVPGADAQQDVVLAGDERDVVDVGHAQQLAAHGLPGPLGDVQVDVGGQRVTGPHRVDDRGVPGDHAFTFQAGDPGVRARPRDVDQVGERAHGHPAVGAQRLDDLPVDVVHRCHMSTQAAVRAVTESHMAKISRLPDQYVSPFARHMETWSYQGRLSRKEPLTVLSR
jgi:hypothetical protein